MSAILPVNDLGIWTIGQLSPIVTLFPKRTDDTVLDLTGVLSAQCALWIYNSAKVKIGNGGGTITIPQPYPALVQYALVTADWTLMATPGQYWWRFVPSFNGGTQPDPSQFISFVAQA